MTKDNADMNLPSDNAIAAELLNPKGRSMFIRVADSPERLVVTPRGIPIWFAAICLCIPLALLMADLGRKAFQSALTPFDFVGLTVALLAVTTFLLVIWWYNRAEAKRGEFFVLDKLRRTITLPRNGQQIEESQIQEFTEVHAWHVHANCNGSSRERLCELSVVIRTESPETATLPLVTSLHARAVHKIGRKLAAFYAVELRVVKAKWRDRKSPARE
jgi:hypothetical protein